MKFICHKNQLELEYMLFVLIFCPDGALPKQKHLHILLSLLYTICYYTMSQLGYFTVNKDDKSKLQIKNGVSGHGINSFFFSTFVGQQSK